jgi:hypothetical protein
LIGIEGIKQNELQAVVAGMRIDVVEVAVKDVLRDAFGECLANVDGLVDAPLRRLDRFQPTISLAIKTAKFR